MSIFATALEIKLYFHVTVQVRVSEFRGGAIYIYIYPRQFSVLYGGLFTEIVYL